MRYSLKCLQVILRNSFIFRGEERTEAFFLVILEFSTSSPFTSRSAYAGIEWITLYILLLTK